MFSKFFWLVFCNKHTFPTAQVSTEKPLQEELASSGWSSWDESALGPCLRYVWGSSLKAVPQEWKAYDNEAKLNFPLGEYRGFTHLWARFVKLMQTLRIFFCNFCNFLQILQNLKRRKHPTKRRKYPTKRRKKKWVFFSSFGLAWDGFLGPGQFEQIKNALVRASPRSQSSDRMWSSKKKVLSPHVLWETVNLHITTCCALVCENMWTYQLLIYGIPSLAVSKDTLL